MTGYQTTMYLAIVLAVIAGVLAILMIHSPTPVTASTNTSIREEQRTGAML